MPLSGLIPILIIVVGASIGTFIFKEALFLAIRKAGRRGNLVVAILGIILLVVVIIAAIFEAVNKVH